MNLDKELNYLYIETLKNEEVLDGLYIETLKNEEVLDFFTSTPEEVAEILDIEKCPNCDEESYILGKCENCGLGYGEEAFFKKINLQIEEIKNYYIWKNNLSKSLEGNGKHIEISLHNGERFIYIDYKNRLNIEKQEILARIKYNGKIFEILANYNIQEYKNYIDGEITKDLNINILKHPEIKGNFKKSKIITILKNQKVDGFLDYKLAEEIIKKILKERFNVYG